ncbi:MAG: acetolactate synthase-1/2/3 large subunit [Hyphomicrobiaceae bacterium]|jgi:acetolactate synthase-1/2/3 large subunit
MNGAESLVRTLLAGGIDVCFTNPGTSEMHFVAALDAVPGMNCVLCLFEGGVTGAADGYYRMAGKPASTLLHLGPGLANGVANLHNAKKAGSGIVNIVGEHATYHIELDAPLTADIEGIARPVSHWIKTSNLSEEIAGHGAEAIAAAMVPPGQVATLILPGDTAWNEASGPAETPAFATRPKVESARVDSAAQALKGGAKTLILLGGVALQETNLRMAGQVATKTGCALLTEWSNTRLDRGAGRIEVNRIPYVVEKAVDVLKPYDRIVLVGARPPVAFFAYPDKPSILTQDGVEFIELATDGEDIAGVLADLVEATSASKSEPAGVSTPRRPDLPKGALDPSGIAAILGNLLPENAVVVDESVTTGREFFPLTAGAPPHSWLNNRGGSIGYGLPVATGAAIACPGQKVIALEGDGSAMYTVQSLWTMARENLDITILVFSNRSYKILRGELTNVGVQNPGPRAIDMLSLNRPDLDWVAMAKGMGVDGVKVDDCEGLAKAFANGLDHEGPYLIEIEL